MTPRRLGFVIALALVAVAGMAQAAYFLSCSAVKDWVTVNGPYENVGSCPMPSQYVTGGVAFADPNAVTTDVLRQKANQQLCASVAKIPQIVLFEPSRTGPNSHAGMTFTYNGSTFKVFCNDPNTGAECASGADLSSITTRFFAVCK